MRRWTRVLALGVLAWLGVARTARALDCFVNFGLVTINTTGVPLAATTVTLMTGQGAWVPAVPADCAGFNAVIFDASVYSTADKDTSAEFVRVTARSGDVLTITRAVEGYHGAAGVARAHNQLGHVYKLDATLTAKTLTEISTGLGAPAAGALTGTTLAANVTASSLTSVGTLGALTVTAPITGSVTGAAGSVAAAALTGTTIASGVTASSLTSFGTSPTLVTPNMTGAITSTQTIAATSTDGLKLTTGTAATNGTPSQWPGRVNLCGSAYNSSSTLAETDCWITENRPVTVAGTTTSSLWFARSINSGTTFVDEFQFRSDGTLNVPNSIVAAAGFNSNGSGTQYQLSGRVLGQNTPPVATTFCSSPSIPTNNGTFAFTVNVGTSCSTSTATLTFPTATTGWVVDCHNVTANSSNVVDQTGGTQTTATLTNYSRTTGNAANWTDGNVLRCKAQAY